MREILFRGKRIDNGEWVEGFYTNLCGKYHFILTGKLDITNGYPELAKNPVDPDTVGQYTGLTDKNGVKIFEGDVIKARNDSAFVICYGEYFPEFYREAIKDNFGMVPDCMHFGLFGGSIKTGEEVVLTNCTHLFEVIGNIHDNPEILEEGGE